jgi:hypothetical protein
MKLRWSLGDWVIGGLVNLRLEEICQMFLEMKNAKRKTEHGINKVTMVGIDGY